MPSEDSAVMMDRVSRGMWERSSVGDAIGEARW